MLDLPLLTDTDLDKPGYYVMLAGAFNAWQGGSLYVDAASPSTAHRFRLDIITPTSGSAWEMVAASTFNVPQGIGAQRARARHARLQYWDRLSVLTVRIANGMDLQSAAEDGHADAAAERHGDRRRGGAVRHRRRHGQRAVEARELPARAARHRAMIDGHAPASRSCAWRSRSAASRPPRRTSGCTDSYRALSLYADNSSQELFSFADTGNSCEPYTVKVYQKFRNVDSDVTVVVVAARAPGRPVALRLRRHPADQ